MNPSIVNQIKHSIFSKRTLYVLCFMALNLIEVLKASQPGAVWYVAVNCTGLVVMVLVVSGWPLRDFLTIGNGIYTAICVVAMIVIGLTWHPTTGQYVLWQLETAVMNIWWIGIVVRYLFSKVFIHKNLPLKPGLMGWIWIVMTLLMTFSVSQRLWPLWFLLMFGSFYLTSYKPEDRTALWDAMVDGTIISFFCVQIYAYGFRPYDEVRYKGAFGNCNMTALYYLIIYMMCLYKLHFLEVKKAHKGWKMFYLIGAGGMLSFQLFTLCRTAWIVSFVITILYGVLVVKKLWKKNWRQIFCRGGALALAAVMTFLPVYYSIRWLPTILHYSIWYEGEYSTNKVHSFDPPDSEKYIDLDEFLDVLLERFKDSLKSASAHNQFVLKVKAQEAVENTAVAENTAAADDNKPDTEMERVELMNVSWLPESMNYRLTIYKAYLKDMTLYGNGLDKGFYLIGDGAYHSWHAQNLWIQIAYTYGIPSGILLLILTLVMLHRYYKRLKESDDPYVIIPFFICVLTFLFGTMEIVWNPGQLIMFLFFFIQHPQLGMDSTQRRIVDQ